MVFILTEIGIFIKSLREERGISQRKLAEKAMISHTELSKIENGEREKSSPNILKKLSEALNIDYNTLLEKSGYIDNNSYSLKELSPKKISKKEIHDDKEAALQKVVKDLKNNYYFTDIEMQQRINFSTKIDLLAFTEDLSVIGINTKYILNNMPNVSRSSMFLNQLEKIIKTDFLNFYFNYRKHGYSDENIKFICVFIIKDIDIKESLNNYIQRFFSILNPMFEYRIYTIDEIEPHKKNDTF